MEFFLSVPKIIRFELSIDIFLGKSFGRLNSSGAGGAGGGIETSGAGETTIGGGGGKFSGEGSFAG